jgi:hypothetical protein
MSEQTLYEKVGGSEGIEKVVDYFYEELVLQLRMISYTNKLLQLQELYSLMMMMPMSFLGRVGNFKLFLGNIEIFNPNSV